MLMIQSTSTNDKENAISLMFHTYLDSPNHMADQIQIYLSTSSKKSVDWKQVAFITPLEEYVFEANPIKQNTKEGLIKESSTISIYGGGIFDLREITLSDTVRLELRGRETVSFILDKNKIQKISNSLENYNR